MIQGGTMSRQVKSLMRSIAFILWFIASQYLIAFSIFLFVGVTSETFVVEHQFLITLLSYVLALGVLIGLDKWKKKDILEGYRDFKYESFYKCIKYIIKYTMYGIGLWILSTFINAIFLPFFPEYGDQMDTLFVNKEHVIRFFVLVIGAPIVEEYIFRGKVQGTLKEAFGPRVAVIAQGLLFGIIHPFGLQKIYASVLGISFGWIREKHGNVMTSTIMHMTINGIGWLMGILSSYFLMQ